MSDRERLPREAAENLLLDAFRAGIEIRPIAGKITVTGTIPPEMRAKLVAAWPDIVALFAAEPNTAVTRPATNAVDRSAAFHQARIAKKEADLAFQGLGPDGKRRLRNTGGLRPTRSSRTGALSSGSAGRES
jgi:hypothetical protein